MLEKKMVITDLNVKVKAGQDLIPVRDPGLLDQNQDLELNQDQKQPQDLDRVHAIMMILNANTGIGATEIVILDRALNQTLDQDLMKDTQKPRRKIIREEGPTLNLAPGVKKELLNRIMC